MALFNFVDLRALAAPTRKWSSNSISYSFDRYVKLQESNSLAGDAYNTTIIKRNTRVHGETVWFAKIRCTADADRFASRCAAW